jgi:hypothetical protein
VKAEIAVVRGKKQYDKRDTERTRELDREAQAAAMKERRAIVSSCISREDAKTRRGVWLPYHSRDL